MASVLILTTLPATLKMSRALIDQYCYLLSQRMSDGSDVSVLLLALLPLISSVHVDGGTMCQDAHHSVARPNYESRSQTLRRVVDPIVH